MLVGRLILAQTKKCSLVDLAQGNIADSVEDPDIAEVAFRIAADGFFYTREGEAPTPFVQGTAWKGDCDNDAYEAMLEVDSLSDPTSGAAIDVWHATTADRDFIYTRTTGGTIQGNVTVSIRRFDDDSDVRTDQFNMSAQQTQAPP